MANVTAPTEEASWIPALSWTSWLLVGIAVALPLLAAGQYTVLAEEKQERMSEQVSETPWSWAARGLALYLLLASGVLSLPVIGYMFDGCFWNAVSGCGSVFTLVGVCLPQVIALFGHDVPSAIQSMSIGGFMSSGLLTAVCMLAGEGASGFVLAFFDSSSTCSAPFYIINILLLVNALLFLVAWYLGEGGGVMSLMRSAG